MCKQRLAALQNKEECSIVVKHAAKYGCLLGYEPEEVEKFLAEIEVMRNRSPIGLPTTPTA